MKPRESLAYFQSQQSAMLEELIGWVKMESPTTDKASVDRFGEEMATKLSDIGMAIRVFPQTATGNHVLGTWGSGDNQILLIGHLDTVWELGTLERFPVAIEGDVVRGPGIFDMKGGIEIAISALRLIREQNFHHSSISLLLTADEEEGSEASREVIEREAARSRCVLVLEPAGPEHSVKTKRRGVGRYRVVAHGRSAHAGIEPEKGVNAVEEIARQILEIQNFNRHGRGVSVNVGLIGGGTRTNVIPDLAWADIDVRCDSAEDMKWLQERFGSLAAKDPQTRLEVNGGVDRPPLVRSEKVLGLFAEFRQIGSEFDYPVTEFWTGGGSDGNFTAALGIPTLDGLGAEGAGAHALNEHILLSSLPIRANLLYHFLRRKIEPVPHRPPA